MKPENCWLGKGIHQDDRLPVSSLRYLIAASLSLVPSETRHQASAISATLSIPLLKKFHLEALSASFIVGLAAQDDISGIERVLAGVCKNWLTTVECSVGNGYTQIDLYLGTSCIYPIQMLFEVKKEESSHLVSLYLTTVKLALLADSSSLPSSFRLRLNTTSLTITLPASHCGTIPPLHQYWLPGIQSTLIVRLTWHLYWRARMLAKTRPEEISTEWYLPLLIKKPCDWAHQEENAVRWHDPLHLNKIFIMIIYLDLLLYSIPYRILSGQCARHTIINT